MQAFVESNPSIKWCPYPACGRAVRLPDSDNPMSPLFRTSSGVRSPADTSHAVDCGNGHIFCWSVACHSLLLPGCLRLILVLFLNFTLLIYIYIYYLCCVIIARSKNSLCRSLIGLLAHNKSHSWWWDPSYRRLSPWLVLCYVVTCCTDFLSYIFYMP